MISQKKIKELLHRLNRELEREGHRGEIGIVGGAAMCLVYNAREMTKDVDAVFRPADIIRRLAEKIATEESLPKDWLNDSVKGFLESSFERQEIFSLSNLKVWSPCAEYLLAMKCLSARWDSSDREDVVFLIKRLGYRRPGDVFALIESYYPKKRILPKAQFFIEEIFERQSGLNE